MRAADPRFSLTEDKLPIAIDICRRLDGLPLAIELAAARVTTLGLQTVHDKLDARFKLLTGGARATLRRHQTLRAALEWSYGLLTEAEQSVFRRLGVFSGGFAMELAQAVARDAAADEWAVLDHLSALVDKSLVVTDFGATPRYRLLESARAFALELLAANESVVTLKRHAIAMQEFLTRVDDAHLDGELRQDQFAALVLPELDNLRAAYAWAMSEEGGPRVAIALAAHASTLIEYGVECADWLLRLLPHVEAATAQSRLLPATGGRWPRASWPAIFHCSTDRCRPPGPILVRGAGPPASGVFEPDTPLFCLKGQNQKVAAQAAIEEARSLVRSDWPALFRIVLLRLDGINAREAGRRDEALALHRDTVRASVLTGDWHLEVHARNTLIDLLWEVEPREEALAETCALVTELRARPAALRDMDVGFRKSDGNPERDGPHRRCVRNGTGALVHDSAEQMAAT